MKLSLVVSSVAVLVAATAAAQSQRPEAVDAVTPVQLGRLLFWDPILSGEGDTSCATCHHPDFAYGDGRELSLGTGSVGLGPARVDRSGGRIPVVKRNSPTVLNTAFNGLEPGRGRRRGAVTPATNPLAVDATRAPMFWDRRVRSLETQALEPLKALEEMRGNAYPESVAIDSVVARLRSIPEYVTLFREAFGTSATIDAARLAIAIAEFERSLVAMNSPLDRFRAGDSTALTAQQRRGLNEFEDAGCDNCHGGPMFSDFDLESEGVAEHRLLAVPDSGAGRFRFRTPSLRNVALTAPYMHNGTLATLDDVLRFYDEGRSRNPNVIDRGQRNGNGNRGRNGAGRGNAGATGAAQVATQPAAPGVAVLSGQFRRVDDMTDQEMADIVAFLGALTDEDFDRRIPERVPSGLPPGGAIAGR